MAGGPESWFTPATIEKHAPGIIFGAVVTAVVLLRLIKSGFLVFGDKAKLLVENAVQAAEIVQLKAEIKNMKEQLDEAKTLLATNSTEGGGL